MNLPTVRVRACARVQEMACTRAHARDDDGEGETDEGTEEGRHGGRDAGGRDGRRNGRSPMRETRKRMLGVCVGGGGGIRGGRKAEKEEDLLREGRSEGSRDGETRSKRAS